MQLWQSSSRNHFEIKKIAINNTAKKRSIGGSIFTSNTNELLDDREIDVIVELINNYEKVVQDKCLIFSNEALVNVRVSSESEINIMSSDFEHFPDGFKSKNIYFMEGRITIDQPKQWNLDERPSIILCEGYPLKLRSTTARLDQCPA